MRLYSYQQQLVDRVYTAWKTTPKVVLAAATGAGKTQICVALSIICTVPSQSVNIAQGMPGSRRHSVTGQLTR